MAITQVLEYRKDLMKPEPEPTSRNPMERVSFIFISDTGLFTASIPCRRWGDMVVQRGGSTSLGSPKQDYWTNAKRDFRSFIYLKLSPGWPDLLCWTRKNYDRWYTQRGDGTPASSSSSTSTSSSSSSTTSLPASIKGGILLTWLVFFNGTSC